LEVVSSARRDEAILSRNETISVFGAAIRKHRRVIHSTTKTPGSAGSPNPETVK
jgi:hypothetical protein